MFSRPAPSAALVTANQRLHQLRARLQKDRPVVGSEILADPGVGGERPLLSQKIAQLPPHLGWDSAPVSQVVRASHAQKLPQNVSHEVRFPQNLPDSSQIISKTEQRKALSVDLSQSVKVYPDIALAMLRQEQAAAGRLWLLLRHLDVDGRGVLRVVNLKKTLTKSKTPHRLCGWRQLRNLLRQGEGIYWQRDKERVWLRSAGKVAAALEVEKLNGRPVAIPVKHLLGTIGEARAYLYASFHAGRQRVDGQTTQKPIARDTLTVLSGVSAESQRGYERRVGIRVRANYTIGENDKSANREERLWQRGGAAFDFVDHHGKQGKPGQAYVAWQLPNNYYVNLAHRPKGRQKRINRTLTDLFMQGMTGNGQQLLEKRYFGEVSQATRALHKRNGSATEAYWNQGRTENGRFQMWYPLAADGC